MASNPVDKSELLYADFNQSKPLQARNGNALRFQRVQVVLIYCLFYHKFLFYFRWNIFLSDSILPVSLASSTAILNNSSSILPDTRVDLHSLYSDEHFLSTYQAICDQLHYSAFTIFSGVKHDAVVSDVLNKFHVPHLSTEMVSESERKERPFSLFL